MGPFSFLARARRRLDAQRRPLLCEQRQAHADPLFDNLCRLVVSPLPRRQILKLALASMAAGALENLGIRAAWARTPCFCNGLPLGTGEACCRNVSPEVPYDPALYFCTPSGGIESLHVLESLFLEVEPVPAKVFVPGHPPDGTLFTHSATPRAVDNPF